MPGFDIYTLLTDATTIRDTDIQDSNTAEFVGKWCVDCTRYINGPADLMSLAEQVSNETAIMANTANRLGSWCYLALTFVGIKAAEGKKTIYDDLLLRADEIREEYRDNLNEKRLGKWFYDFLFYIDYEGDSGIDNFFLFDFEVTPSNLRTGIFLSLYNPNSEHWQIAVDWGDGSSVERFDETNVNGAKILHTYGDPGTYQCMFIQETEDNAIRGISYGFNGSAADPDRLGLIRVSRIGKINNFTTLNFSGCTNLVEVGLTDDHGFENLINTYDYSILFRDTGITKIPENIFSYGNNENPLILQSAFQNTRITDVPNTLFSKVSKIGNVVSLFRQTLITSLPTGLFSSVTGEQIAENNSIETFCANCYNLNNIPQDLFWYFGDSILNANNCFSYCSSLVNIPEDIFKYNTKINNFSYSFDRTGITAIPENLFKYNLDALNMQYTFGSCSNITAIPESLFANNTKITNFQLTFGYCEKLVQIPSNLFSNNINVLNFYATFTGCTSLIEIPLGLFDSNILVTNFSDLFNGCISIRNIPNYLFSNNTSATQFVGTFARCSSIVDVGDGVFDNCINVTTINNLFYGARSISYLPDNLFKDMVNIQYAPYALADTSILDLSIDFFSGQSKIIDATYLFYSSQISYIRKSWFDSMPLITSLEGVFSLCRNLVGSNIEQNPFSSLSNVTTIRRLFYRSNISGSILPGIFSGLTSLTKADDVFGTNDSRSARTRVDFIQYTGDNVLLFPDSNNITDISSIFTGGDIFNTCDGGGNPKKMFDNLLLLNDISDACSQGEFYYTRSDNTTGRTLPIMINENSEVQGINASNLYYNANSRMGDNESAVVIDYYQMPIGISNYQGAFAYLRNHVTAASPFAVDSEGVQRRIWDMAGRPGAPSTINGTSCFLNSTGFSDYNSIPENWK